MTSNSHRRGSWSVSDATSQDRPEQRQVDAVVVDEDVERDGEDGNECDEEPGGTKEYQRLAPPQPDGQGDETSRHEEGCQGWPRRYLWGFGELGMNAHRYRQCGQL